MSSRALSQASWLVATARHTNIAPNFTDLINTVLIKDTYSRRDEQRSFADYGYTVASETGFSNLCTCEDASPCLPRCKV